MLYLLPVKVGSGGTAGQRAVKETGTLRGRKWIGDGGRREKSICRAHLNILFVLNV